jgi:hypothetical protein
MILSTMKKSFKIAVKSNHRISSTLLIATKPNDLRDGTMRRLFPEKQCRPICIDLERRECTVQRSCDAFPMVRFRGATDAWMSDLRHERRSPFGQLLTVAVWDG